MYTCIQNREELPKICYESRKGESCIFAVRDVLMLDR